MLSEVYGVNAAGIWEERARAYPRRSHGHVVEPGDNAGVLSVSSASERGRNMEGGYAGGLLEKIFDRVNHDKLMLLVAE